MKHLILTLALLPLLLFGQPTGVSNAWRFPGDITYHFIHGVGSADSIEWSTGTTQNTYYKINTGAFVSHEADGVVIQGDSIQLPIAGHYLVLCCLALTTSNVNDRIRVKVYINNTPSALSVGRWIINSMGSGLASSRTFYWYLETPANAWISVRVTNQTGSRAIVVQDFKLYVEKKPEL